MSQNIYPTSSGFMGGDQYIHVKAKPSESVQSFGLFMGEDQYIYVKVKPSQSGQSFWVTDFEGLQTLELAFKELMNFLNL